MQSRLIVKNFGPIDFVDLDLRNVNVFIGPQASGKSALAKLFTIFKAPRKFLKNGNAEKNIIAFKDVLEEYNIAPFLKADTEIEFESDEHVLKFGNGSISYTPKLKLGIEDLIDSFENYKKANILDHVVKGKIEELQKKYYSISPKWYNINTFDSEENKSEQFSKVINSFTELEEYLSNQAPLYIPSERNFINIIRSYSLNLLLNNVPIPKHILLFGSELEKSNIEEIDLNFLHENLVYRTVNGEGRIFVNKDNSIKIIEAASGIQSAVNILIPILAQNKTEFQRSFVIEEPELNLFPIAQYELIQLLESLRKDTSYNDSTSTHIYTTHSPYVLSSFNNLLYASKVWNKFGINSKDYNPIVENKLKAIILSRSNIQPTIFSAYQIKNGTAEDIFDREIGLVKDNYIDDASDKMADDFDALMELMK